jgi:hypothetical protein
VDDLKKAIKKENEPELDHLAAHSFVLWKVSTFSWCVLMSISDIRAAVLTHSF